LAGTGLFASIDVSFPAIAISIAGSFSPFARVFHVVGFELTVSSGGEFEIPSAGNHAARFVAVINGGTHETPGVNGQPSKKVGKFLFGLELPHERRSDGRPFVVLYECSASLNTKATLRKLVEQVLNRQLNDGDRFSVAEFLGQPCSVAITLEAKQDKTYFKVASIGPPIRGMVVPEPTYPQLAWSIHGGTPFPAPEWLPFHYGRSVSDWVAESEEGQQAARKPAQAVVPAADPAVDAEGNIAY
jgi:hypothetical protein